MEIQIIYEDNDILAIDKPAGVAVHATDKHDKYFTIVKYLYKTHPDIRGVGENPLRPGIVHRLDKETSGIMVVAKNNEIFFELKKLFTERKIEKKYIALVSGILEQEHGTIDIPLKKMATRTVVSKQTFKNKGGSDPPLKEVRLPHSARIAITAYKVLEYYQDYTLVEVMPKTGRQHQIRVHFASINHPVACDKLYGRKSKKCPPGLERHFLHASHLKFQLKNALMEFESDLPKDLADALKIIEKA
jgi:23S rRNA pseudouridine1911/1915/1917 synthase